MPQRIQLRRSRGWRKPDGVLVVSRPTIRGNPWVGPDAVAAYRRFVRQIMSGVLSVSLCDDGLDAHLVFRKPIDEWHALRSQLVPTRQLTHDFACWCPLDRECHADVWIEVARGDHNDVFLAGDEDY